MDITPKRKAPKTAFKPGQSGNPKGRPRKGMSFSDIIRELSDEVQDGKTVREQIVAKTIEFAKKGVPWAVAWVVDRMEGRAKESVDMNIKDNPLKHLSNEEIRGVIGFAKKNGHNGTDSGSSGT